MKRQHLLPYTPVQRARAFHRRGEAVLFWVGVFLLASEITLPRQALADCEGGSVLAVNGGASGTNSCDFVEDIARTRRAFTGGGGAVCHSAVLDGGQSGYAQAIQDLGCAAPRDSIRSEGVSSATITTGSVRAQILATVRATPAGAPVTLYFTDHGGTGSSGSTVEVGDEEISVDEMRSIIAEVRRERPDQRLIFIHDHCFSGGMLDEIMDASGRVDGNVCGFAAADRHEVALNSQSFARMSDEITRSRYRGLRDAVDRDRDGQYDFSEVFRYYSRSFFTYSNGVGGSTPTSSTDVFLENRTTRYLAPESGRAAIGSRDALLRSCALARNSNGGPLPGVSESLRALFNEHVQTMRSQLGSYYAGAGISPSASFAEIERRVRSHDDTITRLQDEALSASQRSSLLQGQLANQIFEREHPTEFARYRELERAASPAEFCQSSLAAANGQGACCSSAGSDLAREMACFEAIPEATREAWMTEFGQLDQQYNTPAWERVKHLGLSTLSCPLRV